MYSEKYHVIYCDRNGKQFRLGIHEWDYVGPSVRHNAAPIPFSIYEETSSELKVGGIYPSRAELVLVSSKTFNMEELYTADERKYYVTHEPTDGSDLGKWYGYIIPNGFSEEMDNDVHYMILTASDNLSTLQNIPFLDTETGDNYGMTTGEFWRSFMWVAKEALRKTGLTLPIWTMVDVKPMLPSQGGTFAKSVSFISGQMIMADYGVSDILQVDSLIYVNGGANDGRTFVVTGWSTNQAGFPPVDSTTIDVTGDMESVVFPDSVTLIILPPGQPSDYADPLAITVHDTRVYINSETDDAVGETYYQISRNAMTTWEVLNNLGKQWNAKIFQNNGHWEIVRWNAFRDNSADYEYFRYNAEGTLIGRAPFMDEVHYPCSGNTDRTKFRPFGHEIWMDRVLKRVAVNYIYKYKTDGDSLVNLIRNGNFNYQLQIGVPPPTSDPQIFTPQQWDRRNQSSGALPGLMFIQQYLSPPPPGVLYPPGIDSFIGIGGIYHDRTWLTSYTGYPTPVGAGDRLSISWRQRLPLSIPSAGFPAFGGLVIRIIVLDPNDSSNFYMLVNDGPDNAASPISRWVQFTDTVYNFVSRAVRRLEVSEDMSPWSDVSIETPPSPIAGNLIIEIVGIARTTTLFNEPGSSINTFNMFFMLGTAGMTQRQWPFLNKEFRITGIFVGKIVNPTEESVPRLHGYLYEQDGYYTDTIPDIEVLTGDDNNPDHVSNIYVMDGANRVAVKQWNSWRNEFEWNALGLLLAKSVMQLYYRPMRLIDGDHVAPEIGWNTRISFEARPGELYAILRGAIEPKQNRFSGTLVQVYDESTPPLPGGGIDGGTTVDPNWQPTEAARCVRNASGVNTGDVEVMEMDVNPSSPTYGQTRWTNVGENTDTCPIGEPIELLWGSQSELDVNTLNYYPFERTEDEYTVRYDNEGGNGYLRFIHRASMGTVQSIVYTGGYESISGWIYEADLMINGYLYKHLRLTWVTGVYNGLPVTFKIN